ncbi:MAG: helitron helicase-like domain-containing protein [Anaerolineae bacterium]|nr:helitron helicase-like domain-containing protein [Anaerolineae bacterium]
MGIRLKKTTAEVIRAAIEPLGGGKREKVTLISSSAIKNAIEVLTNSDPELNSMIVATYPDCYPDDGRIVKAHHKALHQAIKRKFGGFSYFTAIEYQKRGAPHFHQGLSVSLADFGEVVTLKRHSMTRRKPTFQTNKPLQDWAFETWLEIISKPDISYNGESLDWAGLDDDDIEMMRKAYYEYNAGFSWEVMREKDGAKRYFVKELTGLKLYQKKIPAEFSNPGRHFLYSRDMIFDPEDAMVFILPEGKIRELLEAAGWEYLPDPGKPLYKNLWNAAAGLAVALIQAGYQPVKSSLDALKRYADQRMVAFFDPLQLAEAGAMAYAKSVGRYNAHWNQFKQRLARAAYWENVLWTGPPV